VSEAREVVLARIRAALGEPRPAAARARPAYRRAGERSQEDVLALFVTRVEDYGAQVVETDDAATAVAGLLVGARKVVVPPDLDPALRPHGVELIEDAGLPPTLLDTLDGALTTCAAACAETGTIALDGGPGQGRRAITLVPDLHVCVVEARQIVETVPELFRRLEPSARAGRPIVLVSGPSATSDIELNRVEGVHGPRRLAVVLVGGG
jgi:L-lactate dehydrogenase complex protein LldG